MSAQMSLKEQFKTMIDQNIEEFPDAIELLVELAGTVDLSSRKTKYERFVEALQGNNGEFFGHPFDETANNILDLVKWYINKYDCSTSYALKRIKANIGNLP